MIYSREKNIAAKELGVALMVEDKPANIIRFRRVTDVLIFYHPYNCDLSGRFVKDWFEVMECLKR